MAEISGVSEGTAIDTYDLSVGINKEEKSPAITTEADLSTQVEKKDEKASIAPTDTNASPGESEEILKAREVMHRALAPNLRALDREQEIKIQLEVPQPSFQKFPLAKELFKLKLEAFKREGLSIDEFIQEARKRIDNKDFNLSFDGKNGDLKTELFALYNECLYLAGIMKQQAKIFSYSSPYLQLFELEKETGVLLFGTQLLIVEAQAYTKILKNRFSGIILDVDFNNAKPFYWLTALPGFEKILHHLEQEDEEQSLKLIIDSTISLYFDPAIYRVLSKSKDAQDPLIPLLPYIVKYSSLEKIKDYFNERFKDLKAWDKDYQWIDLHCQAAEILASIDPEKAKNYLEKAGKEVEARLWCYSFSFHRAAIEETRQKALQRIAEAKAKSETFYKEAASS